MQVCTNDFSKFILSIVLAFWGFQVCAERNPHDLWSYASTDGKPDFQTMENAAYPELRGVFSKEDGWHFIIDGVGAIDEKLPSAMPSEGNVLFEIEKKTSDGITAYCLSETLAQVGPLQNLGGFHVLFQFKGEEIWRHFIFISLMRDCKDVLRVSSSKVIVNYDTIAKAPAGRITRYSLDISNPAARKVRKVGTFDSSLIKQYHSYLFSIAKRTK